MRIDTYIWLDRIEDKIISKHGVYPHEVEEMLSNAPRTIFREKGYTANEDVYAAFGQTYGGRYVVAYYIYKPDHRALILSARDMTRKEKRRYGRK